mgnify:CR=1 FL=1
MKTEFAPAARERKEKIISYQQIIENDKVIKELLDNTPHLAGLLNKYRQFIYTNESFINSFSIKNLSSLLGMRPGEIFGCIHARENPAGCGTAISCRYCGITRSILAALEKSQTIIQDARLSTIRKNQLQSFDLRITSKPIQIENKTFIMLFIEDISSEKRKKVYEQTFFHDIFNSINELSGLVEIMHHKKLPTGIPGLNTDSLYGIVDNIKEQIQYYKNINDAEKGQLKLNLQEFEIASVISDIINRLQHWELVKERGLEFSFAAKPIKITTDKVLFHRIMLNMLKNAVEATEKPGEITIKIEKTDSKCICRVNNPVYIPLNVQKQIFQRSFSTKGKNRGLGTYSMKLLSENYLNGHITFKTDEDTGTVFILKLPLVLAQDN